MSTSKPPKTRQLTNQTDQKQVVVLENDTQILLQPYGSAAFSGVVTERGQLAQLLRKKVLTLV